MSEHPAPSPLTRAIFLTGPTASGKTAVGVALAERLSAEVLAMDSMTLYRGMDIGTAKPTVEERRGVPHHLIDLIDPWESASVADYREWAIRTAADVESRERIALFVGGTALYLKTLLRGLFEGPAAVPGIRERLEAEADRIGDDALHARLAAVDPSTAARLHPNDRRRVIRALEVWESTGKPISEHHREHDRPAPAGMAVLALGRDADALKHRIDRRVVAMFDQGLIDEVRGLLDGPRPLNPVPAQGVGYLEVIQHLRGELTCEQAIERTQARTRQFAKRQRTWFRGLEEVRIWPVGEGEAVEGLADALAREVDRIRSMG